MLIIAVISPHLYSIQTYFLSEMIALIMYYLNTANVELPHVLDLAVHLSTWIVRGCHSETFRHLATPASRSFEKLITFSLNMLNYTMFLISLSTWSN